MALIYIIAVAFSGVAPAVVAAGIPALVFNKKRKAKTSQGPLVKYY